MDSIMSGAMVPHPSPMMNYHLQPAFPLEAGEHGLTIGQAVFLPKSPDWH